MAAGEDELKIFIIGPMRMFEKERSLLSFSRPEEHTRAIKAALEDILETDEAKALLLGRRAVVGIPDEKSDVDIRNDVFSKLDDADLVVADLHLNRPSVYYELALVHALGLPAIMVTKRSKKKAPPGEFYLRPYQIIEVGAFTRNDLKSELHAPLITYLRREASYFENPVRGFYDNSIVNLSASAGVAMAYYVNFVREIITEGEHDLAKSFDKLYIVRVDDIVTRRGEDERLNALARQVTGSADVKTSFDRPINREARPIGVVAAGRTVLDGATTVYTLADSPRYKRLLRLYDHTDEIMRRMRKRMIDAFYDAIRVQIRLDSRVDRDKCEILPLEQIEERLLAGA